MKKSQRKEWYIPIAEKFVTTNNSATVKGVRSADEIQAAVGKSGGMLVRAHVDQGETRVYFAGPESASCGVLRSIDGAETHKDEGVQEVSRIDCPQLVYICRPIGQVSECA